MEKGNWTYLTAPEDLWAKVKDNAVDKEVRVIAIGINQDTSESLAQDDGHNTVLLIADPDSTCDRELKEQWHELAQVRRLFFRPRRRFGR